MPVGMSVLYRSASGILRKNRMHMNKTSNIPAQSTTPTNTAVPPASRSIPGLDTVPGLRNVGGNLATDLRLFRRFAENYQADSAPFEAAIAARDLTGAQHFAQSLTGAAGALRAPEVQARAAAIEAALRADGDPASIPRMAHALHSTLAPLVRHLVLPCDVPPAITATTMDIVTALDRFEALLTASDFSALATPTAAVAALREHLGDAAIDLERHMDHCDFSQTLAVLRRARQNKAHA